MRNEKSVAVSKDLQILFEISRVYTSGVRERAADLGPSALSGRFPARWKKVVTGCAGNGTTS